MQTQLTTALPFVLHSEKRNRSSLRCFGAVIWCSTSMEEDFEKCKSSITATLKRTRELLLVVRYNHNMLQFFGHQLNQTHQLLLPLVPTTDAALTAMDILREEIEKSAALVGTHARPFDFQSYCKVETVQDKVQNLCSTFVECFRDLGVQADLVIQQQIDENCVNGDKRYLYWLLKCILKGSRMGMELGDDAHQELEEEIAEQRRRIQTLNFLNEGDIRCLRRIGGGSFGTVFKAQFGNISAAVKQLPQDISLDAEATFFSEVEVHSKMEHPNVVHCYGALPSSALVMELANCDLQKYLSWNGAKLPLSSKVRLMEHASAGLKYLHESRIVHRDVKSSNFLVFFSKPGVCPTIKIGDFGLAVAKMESRSRTGSPTVGSQLWMAPEVLEGAPHNERSDVFSFGVVLFEIATIDTPYRGFSTSTQSLRQKKEWRDPCFVPEGFPAELLHLMRSCVHPVAKKRPTMTEVLDGLRNCVLPVAKKRPTMTEVLDGLRSCDQPAAKRMRTMTEIPDRVDKNLVLVSTMAITL